MRTIFWEGELYTEVYKFPIYILWFFLYIRHVKYLYDFSVDFSIPYGNGLLRTEEGIMRYTEVDWRISHISWYFSYIRLQCVAVCCSVLQCVAVCCSVLQCVAVCCSVLQCFVHDISHTSDTSNTRTILQSTLVYCMRTVYWNDNGMLRTIFQSTLVYLPYENGTLTKEKGTLRYAEVDWRISHTANCR